MPTVALVDGMRIYIYSNEHGIPHFHVLIAEYRIAIDIETLETLEGFLPRPRLKTILDWAEPRRDALRREWDNATAGFPTRRIT